MHATCDLDVPTSLDEALPLLQDQGAMAIAGGTNVIVDWRAGRVEPRRLVSLSRVPGLRGIRTHDGSVSLGGSTTVTDLLESEVIARTAPALVEAARVFGGQMVRNAATVAGNIASGSPAADLMPPLISLDAVLTLVSAEGRRTLPLDAFFTGYKRDARRPGELIAEVSFEALPARAANLFYKLGRRKGDAITVAGVAVTVAQANGRCVRARIALGAVGPTVHRARDAEAMLEGQSLTPALIEAAARQAAAASCPIDDIRASAEYRRHSVFVLTRRLVTQAWERVA